jgi:alpha-1,2-glucosyltransferase
VLQFGAFSILFRQTNVIWIIFFAANGAISYIQDLYPKDNVSHENIEATHQSDKVVSGRDNKTAAQGLRRRRINSPMSKKVVVSESSKLYNSECSISFN